MPPLAVCFDFDGVLAETENVHVAAWERTFGAMGWDVPPAVCARAAEVEDHLVLAEIFAGRAISAGDVPGWVRRKQALTLELLRDAPRLYPGVADLLRSLQGRVRLAVVTTTWRENVLAVLDPDGLTPLLDLIVAKEDVALPKPDPECYLLALDRLGLDPGDVVALDDSPNGLAAAQAAGLRVVAIGHRRPPGDWALGVPFLPNLTDPDAVRAAIL